MTKKLLWLCEIRCNLNMTQEEAARASSITQSQYCTYENGKHRPSYKQAKKIADALMFDVSKFF